MQQFNYGIDLQAQEDRNKALESAAEDGVIRDYSGWRQSLKGTRFQIKSCTLFNLETPTGKKVILGPLTCSEDPPPCTPDDQGNASMAELICALLNVTEDNSGAAAIRYALPGPSAGHLSWHTWLREIA